VEFELAFALLETNTPAKLAAPTAPIAKIRRRMLSVIALCRPYLQFVYQPEIKVTSSLIREIVNSCLVCSCGVKRSANRFSKHFGRNAHELLEGFSKVRLIIKAYLKANVS
jgi:hypothetical protein